MGTRRQARERTVQFLFQNDLNPVENLDEALALFWSAHQNTPSLYESPSKQERSSQENKGPSPTQIFAEPLIRGVMAKIPELDNLIKGCAVNWDLKRMAVVDRNILRLSIYEMLYRDDIPPVVSINEAVEIAKRFSTDDSSRFVNGILDKIKQDVLRPSRMSAL